MISDTRVASERTLLEHSNRIHDGNLLTLPIADRWCCTWTRVRTAFRPTPNSSTFPQLPRAWSASGNPDPATESGPATPRPWLTRSTRCSGPGSGRRQPHPAELRPRIPHTDAPAGNSPTRHATRRGAPRPGPNGPTVPVLAELLPELRTTLDSLEAAVNSQERPGR